MGAKYSCKNKSKQPRHEALCNRTREVFFWRGEQNIIRSKNTFLGRRRRRTRKAKEQFSTLISDNEASTTSRVWFVSQKFSSLLAGEDREEKRTELRFDKNAIRLTSGWDEDFNWTYIDKRSWGLILQFEVCFCSAGIWKLCGEGEHASQLDLRFPKAVGSLQGFGISENFFERFRERFMSQKIS